jgi:hypothetical protein
VNTAYVRGTGGIVWPQFFARIDVGDTTAPTLADLPGRLPAMRASLGMMPRRDESGRYVR